MSTSNNSQPDYTPGQYELDETVGGSTGSSLVEQEQHRTDPATLTLYDTDPSLFFEDNPLNGIIDDGSADDYYLHDDLDWMSAMG